MRVAAYRVRRGGLGASLVHPEVLERCGQHDACAVGEVKACYASARNGYRDSKECETLEWPLS